MHFKSKRKKLGIKKSLPNNKTFNSPENITMNNSKIMLALLYKTEIDRITRTKWNISYHTILIGDFSILNVF